MKRFLALFLSLIMALSLAACGNADVADTSTDASSDTESADTTQPDAKPYEGITLSITESIHKDEATDVAFWESFLAPFEEETGAEVDVLLIDAGNVNAQTIANLSAGAGSDLFLVCGGNEATFVANGFCEELDSYFTEEQKSTWIHYEDNLTEGKHYTVPWTGGAAYRVIFMNKDLCEELGLEIPSYEEFTWDTLLEYGQAAVAAGKKGYVAPWIGDANAPMCNYINFLYQAGGSILDENGDYALDSPESIEAMRFINDMFNTTPIVDTVNYTYDAAIAEFNEGNALFLGAAMYSTASFTDAFEIEAYHMQNVSYGCANAIDYMAINSASEHKEAAAALLSYMMEGENWSKLRNELFDGAGVILNSVDNTQVFEPRFAHLIDECDNYWQFPAKEAISEACELMITHQQLVAMGDETPEEACQVMQESVEVLLAD